MLEFYIDINLMMLLAVGVTIRIRRMLRNDNRTFHRAAPLMRLALLLPCPHTPIGAFISAGSCESMRR